MSADLFSPDSYDFELPPERIAQHAAEPRDSSRLLVLHRANGKLEHRRFSDLPEYYGSEDLLVANNTRVLRPGSWADGSSTESRARKKAAKSNSSSSRNAARAPGKACFTPRPSTSRG